MRRDLRARYGPVALVAGASEGIGAAFARQLAAAGLDLVLVARRAAPLEALAAEVRRDFKVSVHTVAHDLGAHDLLPVIQRETGGMEIGLLVYNAARSVIGPFLDGDIHDLVGTLDVNCRAPLLLCHAFGNAMVTRNRGGILLMSSTAGMQGSPLVAAYAATKAWNIVFAEGLWDELRTRGVDVLACCAGATRTPAYEQSSPRGQTPTMEPEAVVAEALAALGRGPSMVPGWTNKAAAFVLGRLLPRRTSVQIMGAATRRMYGRP